MSAELILSATGDSTIDNSAAETSMFSGSVPAGTPGADELLILRHIGDLRNDSGSNQTVRHRIKYGGTTFHDFTSIPLADAGAVNRYADIGMCFLAGQNASNSQRSMYEHRQGGNGSGAGGTSGGNDHNVTVNTGAIDSSSSQTLEWTAQLSAANTELEFRRRGVWVERWSTDAPASGTAGTRLVNIDTSEVTINNTTTETTVWTAAVPGGTLGTGNLLIGRLHMDALNNSGSDKQWWVSEISYGGSDIFAVSTGTNNATSAQRRGFPIEFWLGGAGTTGTQVGAVVGHSIGGATGTGEGVHPGGVGGSASHSTNALSIDSTVSQNIVVKVTLSTADPNLTVRKLIGALSVVKA